MSHLKYPFLSVLLMLTISCTPILLKVKGIKQPALENHKSLSRFLSSFKADTTEMLCFKNNEALSKYYATRLGVPNAQFFNREKKFVDYRRAPSDCNANVTAFIENVDSINLFIPQADKVISDFLQNVVVQNSQQAFNLEMYDYDAYVLVYWAKYMGKVTKSHVKEWQETVQNINKNGRKIRMLLIDIDYQSFWGMKPGEVPKFNY